MHDGIRFFVPYWNAMCGWRVFIWRAPYEAIKFVLFQAFLVIIIFKVNSKTKREGGEREGENDHVH